MQYLTLHHSLTSLPSFLPGRAHDMRPMEDIIHDAYASRNDLAYILVEDGRFCQSFCRHLLVDQLCTVSPARSRAESAPVEVLAGILCLGGYLYLRDIWFRVPGIITFCSALHSTRGSFYDNEGHVWFCHCSGALHGPSSGYVQPLSSDQYLYDALNVAIAIAPI